MIITVDELLDGTLNIDPVLFSEKLRWLESEGFTFETSSDSVEMVFVEAVKECESQVVLSFYAADFDRCMSSQIPGVRSAR